MRQAILEKSKEIKKRAFTRTIGTDKDTKTGNIHQFDILVDFKIAQSNGFYLHNDKVKNNRGIGTSFM